MPRTRLPTNERQQWVVLLGFLAAAALVITLVLIFQAGPNFSWKRLAFWQAKPDPAVIEQLRQDSIALEEQFNARIFLQAPTEEDLAPLRAAIEKQRAYIAALERYEPAAVQRVERLETQLADARGRGLQAASKEAEQRARDQLASGETQAGLESLRAAYEAQRQINRSKAAGLRDTARETALGRELANLEVVPLIEESRESEKLARSLVAQERWTEGLAAFSRARDLQRRINADYPSSIAASTRRVEELEIEIASFSTGGLIQEIESLLESASRKVVSGQHTEAAQDYREALKLQIRINEEHPRSRFADRAKVEELRTTIETTESFEPADRLKGRIATITKHLAVGEVAAARPEIEAAAAELSDFQVRFRRSKLLEEELRLQVTFLQEVRASLNAIQREVRDNLRPLDGQMMLATEVPQRLYQQVMLANPSRNAGGDLPVESVTWSDAQEFCRRLGWALGRPVTLPTLAQFRAAVGSFDAEQLAAGQAWIAENSNQRTQPVGTAQANAGGFFDLLGNVDEWLDDSGTSGLEAIIAGGAYLDRTGAFSELPVASRLKTERSRRTGFRFMVGTVP